MQAIDHAAAVPETPYVVSGPFGAPRPVDAPPWQTAPGVRAAMQGNRRRDTAPEMAVRRLLHARGLRYRVDAPPLAGLRRRADLVFTRQRLAVFIDGCYWHGCPEHYKPPSTNPGYWTSKVGANVKRDRDTDERLIAAGWTVLRVWEQEDAADVADRVAALRSRLDDATPDA